MSTTVHILVCGSHSDRQNAGVYTTKELAEAARRLLVDPEDAYVEEWDVDNAVPTLPAGMKLFAVDLSPNYSWFEQIDAIDADVRLNEVQDAPGKNTGHVRIHVHARDGEDAVKIASEIRSKHVALGGVTRPNDHQGT